MLAGNKVVVIRGQVGRGLGRGLGGGLLVALQKHGRSFQASRFFLGLFLALWIFGHDPFHRLFSRINKVLLIFRLAESSFLARLCCECDERD